MSLDELAKQDSRFDTRVSSRISGEDDEEDLAATGTGLVVKNPLRERAAYIPPKIYCTRCLKGIHNISENDQRCLGSRKKGRSDCQCPCQTHYVGKDGKLRKHGTPDDSFKKDALPKTNPENDAEIARLTAEWHALHKTTPKKINPEPEAAAL